MRDLTPIQPYRPLVWNDAVLDIKDSLLEESSPVFIVGGAVRDAMLSRPIHDLDLATPGDSVAIARRIANSVPGGALYVMDKERGVARAMIETMHGDMQIDVARFRGEAVDDLLQDLQDRDFTINAMAVDLHSDLTRVIDPTEGERDIAHKVIRQCREGSITSDPVRAIRGIRQSVQLEFKLEPSTLSEIRAAVPLLTQEIVSWERIRDELFNVLSLKRPVAALRVMDMIEMLDAVIGEDSTPREAVLSEIDKFTQLLNGLIPSRRGNNLSTDFGFGLALMQLNAMRSSLEAHMQHRWANDRRHFAFLLLCVLLQHREEDELEIVLETLRLSNSEKKRAYAFLQGRYLLADAETSELAMHRFWYSCGEAGVDICLYTLASYLAEVKAAIDQDRWLDLVETVRVYLDAYYLQYDRIVQPPLLLDGKQIIKLTGITPGPQVGELLDALREAQAIGEVLSEEQAVHFVNEQVGKSSLS